MRRLANRDMENVFATAMVGVRDMLDLPIHHPFFPVALNREGVVPELVDVLIGRGFTSCR